LDRASPSDFARANYGQLGNGDDDANCQPPTESGLWTHQLGAELWDDSWDGGDLDAERRSLDHPVHIHFEEGQIGWVGCRFLNFRSLP
jgi:hypothetical protein